MANAQLISGNGKQVLILDTAQFSALNALLYGLSDNPELIASLSRENSLGLASNHIESVAALWSDIHRPTS